jgi:AraC family transcriptional regulator
MEWLKQLSQALDYIETHLDQEISLEEAARIACCSSFYFQRMFAYVAGVTLAEYIRRRRMSLAAFELQTSPATIMEVGFKYGYTSPTAFNRAFQSVHGVAPSAARQAGTRLQAYPRLAFQITLSGDEALPYRVENKPAFRVVGASTPLQEDQESNFKIAPAFWQAMLNDPRYPQICKLGNQPPYGVLGVTSYTSPTEIYYTIAVASDLPAPPGLSSLEFPAAAWVIFEVSGPFPTAIQTAFRRFFTEWLPFSGYSYAGLPDLEIYPLTPVQKAEVWIAIKK